MKYITKQDVVKDIKRVANTVNVFTREAYRANGNYSSWLVENRFRTFSNAVRAAKVRNVVSR